MNLKSFSAESSPGPFLQTNEDAYDFDLPNELFMLLDGFGGAGIGDVAVGKLKENIKTFYTKFSSDPDSTMPFYFSPKYLLEGNALINSLLYAHSELFKENQKKEFSRRAGASGVFVAKSESIASIVSIGACATFLYRDGKFERVLVEDSYRFLSGNSSGEHLKTMPLSGFGLFPDLYYQVKEVRLRSGDKLVIMSDGVFGRLGPEEIKDVVSSSEETGKEKITRLFERSNDRGNLDNQSCMILEF